ncbi:phosphoenolpyruvate--protein phosphotransferase [Ketobacter sp. MCCC 1A13808]|uniref:phosphoenolpyruvate--protein phosphotransferase n=1 Tax=Ketobacter sp. MCCC 1A13808 TaxID=2602738 RepID=UPI000F2795F2|nr:phosphoenolpyruvate--protein phosphotransferase [Ketobacter sp. MCCC 1A13808]MVF11793.1 phosphoenolpyruvate--protein phosphotransferase [Ketobacter sp. MCCC 1A13808]RLP55400.1 MAG: phosphoenolpyruvate-protein phosphotransferase PtsP [Ketobacter sp.]
MLEILRRIVQEVNAAPDLSSALNVMVTRVRLSMGTEVCSIYLLDHTANCYYLMATEGLNKKAVGTATLQFSEGLVGQVGMREEPINLDDAPSHPKFRFLQETGEEPFHSFLGVPIIHHRKLLGVLVVQQRDSRRFDQEEEAFLVTISAQLAAVVAHAEATGAIDGIFGGTGSLTAKFDGVVGCIGVAIGKAFVAYPPTDFKSVPDRAVKNVKKELRTLNDAVKAVRSDIRALSEKASLTLPPEEHALFQVYERMLDDNALAGEIRRHVEAGNWVQGALREVVQKHVAAFEAMEDAYLRARASDVRDLGLRILAYLQQAKTLTAPIPEQAIIVGEDITPTIFVDIPRERIAGIVSLHGSSNSHMSIVARSLGIPTVVGVGEFPLSRLEGLQLIVDGHRGEVIIAPSVEVVRQYQAIIDEQAVLSKELEVVADLPCETTDGHRIKLFVNTGLMADVNISLQRGAEGVGLYRTEIPFMVRDRFPSELEQMEIYRQQLEAFHPAPVTMRTLDIGGDKALPYFPIQEANPFLGWRGIRVTLDHPEIFLVQIRAMLWASESLDNLRIMLPMVSSMMEIDEAMHLIHRAYLEVLEEGAHVQMPEVGLMIEVPAAVYQIRDFAQQCDFVSVGSNDLTQYLLAVDRNNRRVASLYQAMHPAVLRALKQIVDVATEEGTPVSICGEMAGDPRSALLLMAMGYETLSMSASSLLRVKWVLRKIGMDAAKELLEQVWKMDNAAVIRSHVDLMLDRAGLGSFIRPTLFQGSSSS